MSTGKIDSRKSRADRPPEDIQEAKGQVRRGASGLFLTVYGLGCLLFVVVLFRSTSYRRGRAGHPGAGGDL